MPKSQAKPLRLVKVVKIGHGRYIAVGRALPFLKVGDFLEAEVQKQNGEIILLLRRYKVVPK